jgi:RNA dependent RNA polymerase
MGDFSLIRVPSKYAARMGQTFSSTVGTVMLENVHFTQEDDLYDASMVRAACAPQTLRSLGVAYSLHGDESSFY